MSDSPTSTSPNNGPRNRVKELGKDILKAAVVAALGALIGLFKDEIHAYVYSFVGKGTISGNYVLKTWEYQHNPPYEWKPFDANVSLKQGGTRIFGEQTLSEPRAWRIYGYYREPFLALAYENKDSAAIGAGTYSLQHELPYLFVGYWSGVECKETKRAWAECPCILYRADHPEQAVKEDDFLKTKCRWVEVEPAVPCTLQNTAKSSPEKPSALRIPVLGGRVAHP